MQPGPLAVTSWILVRSVLRTAAACNYRCRCALWASLHLQFWRSTALWFSLSRCLPIACLRPEDACFGFSSPTQSCWRCTSRRPLPQSRPPGFTGLGILEKPAVRLPLHFFDCWLQGHGVLVHFWLHVLDLLCSIWCSCCDTFGKACMQAMASIPDRCFLFQQQLDSTLPLSHGLMSFLHFLAIFLPVAC